METKIIVNYWSDQSAGISGEPPMRDKSGYPITVHQAKEWCKEHGYEYYVVEAAGDYGSYVSEKSEGAPHKCKGCPYDSEWSCLVKFALAYGKEK